MTSTPELLLCAVGDVAINRKNPGSGFDFSLPLLQQADVLFGNCEAPYTDLPERAPSAGLPLVVGRENIAGIGLAGFNVMSCANNHMVDAGHAGMLETLTGLHDQGVLTCGAGESPIKAFEPAIIERGMVKVAFIAYSCVYPPGYDARHGRPGIATMRTHTVYTASEVHDFQSGGVPEQFTVGHPSDIRAMSQQIAKIRDQVDFVIMSFHWGDGTRPFVLLDYEIQIAHAAIDAGADVILGHHHHMLRGIEFWSGKPIFYGLGHFVFDMPEFGSMVNENLLQKMHSRAGEYAYTPRDDYPLLPMHPDSRMTVMTVCRIREGIISDFGVVPFLIDSAGRPTPQSLDDPGGKRVMEYLREANRAAGFQTQLKPSTSRIAGYQIIDAVPHGEDE